MSDFDPRWIVLYPAIAAAFFLLRALNEARKSDRDMPWLLGFVGMFALSVFLTVRFANA